MLPRRLVVALAAIARASDALSVDPFAWRDRDPFAPAGAAMAAASRLRSAAAVAPVGAPAPRPATSLRYYLDTANADEWAALLPLGIFRGVTTNPTLSARASRAVHHQRNISPSPPPQKNQDKNPPASSPARYAPPTATEPTATAASPVPKQSASDKACMRTVPDLNFWRAGHTI